MQHEIQSSLIDHLRKATSLNVVWVYDGVTLPESEGKTYMTVEQLPNSTSILSKGREAVRTIYRFQVGLYAKTAAERARKQSEVLRILTFDEIPLLDTAVPTLDVIGKLDAQVLAETPITPTGVEQESRYNRVYFDVEVDYVMHRRK